MNRLLNLIIFIPILIFSQVGINTEEPKSMLDINGDLRIQKVEKGSDIDKILVIDKDGYVKYIDYKVNIFDNCPIINKNLSGDYYVYFESLYSIPKPNNDITINNLKFGYSGAGIKDNKYWYSYSNFSGKPLNSKNLDINFNGLICKY